MMVEERDAGSVAVEVSDMLTELDDMHGADGGGWTFNGMDTGEIEITTPEGLMFRLVAYQVESFDV